MHLHVFNPAGELYLQRRPLWKDIQPGKWDTAVGGHVDFGEEILSALLRETREELGLTDFEPEFMQKYVFESEREKELVHVFRIVTTQTPHPTDELDGGRFFSEEEIRQRLQTDFFTPNFEQEWKRLFDANS
ncbi:MAG: NUDIX domain-containing protein [Bacteroidales bacterium]|nr:NUDIX domain-containing protein [Bacteroidales bacterium]